MSILDRYTLYEHHGPSSIGTFAASTAHNIALVLPQDGQMVTIDVNDDWVALGRPIWKKLP